MAAPPDLERGVAPLSPPRNLHYVLQSGCTDLHSHERFRSVNVMQKCSTKY